jgi:hypothetical protein
MVVDSKVQVPGAGRMKVETSILYPGFDHTESRRKLSKEYKNVQNCKIIPTEYPTTLVTESLLKW